VATQALPTVSRADAEHLVNKLQTLRGTLSAGERQALDNLLRVSGERIITEPSAQELLADFPDGPELLEDVAGFAGANAGEPDQITPITITVVTVTVVNC
jgi:hypothetical protein